MYQLICKYTRANQDGNQICIIANLYLISLPIIQQKYYKKHVGLDSIKGRILIRVKPYHYILFSMYRFFADVVRDEDPWMPTLGLSSALLFANFLVVLVFIENNSIFDTELSRLDVILVVTLLSILNYFINFRSLAFLSYDFQFDLKAFITLILYTLLSFALIVVLS